MTSLISARSESCSAVKPTRLRERLGFGSARLAVDRKRELRRHHRLAGLLVRPRRLGDVELELAAVALRLLVHVGDRTLTDQHVARVRPLATVVDELLLAVQDGAALAAEVLDR